MEKNVAAALFVAKKCGVCASLQCCVLCGLVLCVGIC